MISGLLIGITMHEDLWFGEIYLSELRDMEHENLLCF